MFSYELDDDLAAAVLSLLHTVSKMECECDADNLLACRFCHAKETLIGIVAKIIMAPTKKRKSMTWHASKQLGLVTGNALTLSEFRRLTADLPEDTEMLCGGAQVRTMFHNEGHISIDDQPIDEFMDDDRQAAVQVLFGGTMQQTTEAEAAVA